MPFANINELEIHYELLGDRGPCLTMAHGLGGNLEAQLEWAEIAAGLGCQILVYSARGHGRSTPMTDPDAYSFDNLQADLLALLDDVQWERPIVAGASMGAATTAAFAIANPDRLRGLLQIAPAFGESPPFFVAQGFALVAGLIETEGARGAIETLIERVPGILGPAQQSEKLLDELIETWSSHQPESIAAAMRRVPDQLPFSSIEDLRKITVPTLIVAFDGDPIHPLEVARRYAELIPDSRLMELPLNPPLTDDPKRFAELVVEFARSLQ